jgi:tetratricopeptide (TPR) repeat protein
MLTILITVLVSTLASIGIYFISYSYFLSLLVGIILLLGLNYFIGRKFLNKLTELFKSVEKDMKASRYDKAISRLKDGYKYSKWQLFVKEQINSQIGIIYYMKKDFKTAKEYLEKGFSKNWLGMCMLATMYFKEKKYDKVEKIMEKAVKAAKKEGFVYSVYAYFLTEMGRKDKAIQILQKGSNKAPLDEKLESNLENLKNGKKMKMQNYGAMWMQLNIDKMPQGVKPYQMLLNRQKIKRR